MRKINIPIFIPHEGCCHDCVFCNQRKITGVESSVTPKTARQEISDYLNSIKTDDCEIEIAYFGGSFTGLDISLQRDFLEVASSFDDKRIVGVRMSTRPDYITDEILSICKEFGVKTIELGVQSTADDVLELNKRGHTFSDVVNSVKMIKESGIDLGLQMMVGMYGSSPEKDIKTCEDIISLSPKCTRIYPTLVLNKTHLEKLYYSGIYVPYDLETAIEVSKECFVRFRKNDIDVIRMGLYPGDDLRSEGTIISGPFHSAFGELVQNAVYRDEIELDINKLGLRDCDYEVLAKKQDMSKIIGQKRCNANYFLKKYGINLIVKTGR